MHGGVAGPPYLVTFASAPNLASVPPSGFAPDTINANEALTIAQSAAPDLDQWATPELGIVQFDPAVPAIRAWAANGQSSTVLKAATLFANAANGNIETVRDNVYAFAQVEGNVRAWVTQAPHPDPRPNIDPQIGDPCDPPTECPPNQELVSLAQAYVELDSAAGCPAPDCSGARAVTGADGGFTIEHSGGTPYALRSTVRIDGACFSPEQGPAFNIVSCSEVNGGYSSCVADADPPTISSCAPNPPDEADILYDDPSAFARAQVNALYHLTLSRTVFGSYLGDPRQLDVRPSECGGASPLNVAVNQVGPGGAFAIVGGVCPALSFSQAGPYLIYDGLDPQFPGDPITAQLVSTSYSTILAHEFAHYLAQRFTGLGSGFSPVQGAFGEGYGDAWALLLYDPPPDPATGVPGVAAEFCGPGTYLRSIVGDTQPTSTTVTSCAPIAAPCAHVENPASPGSAPERWGVGQCGAECIGGTGVVDGAYYCGKVVSGAWWHTLDELRTTSGLDSVASLAHARLLFVAWSALASVPSVGGPIDGVSLAAILAVDDHPEYGGDGIVENGTPNQNAICSAFALHGLQCPTVFTVTPIDSRSLRITILNLPPTTPPEDPVWVRVIGRNTASPNDNDTGCVLGYVGADGAVQAQPYLQPAAAWDGFVVRGEGIAPSASYQFDLFEPGFLFPFAHVGVRTPRLEDLNGDLIVDLDDVLCVLDGFSNWADCPTADIVPCSGNGLINLDDLLQVLEGFSAQSAQCGPC